MPGAKPSFMEETPGSRCPSCGSVLIRPLGDSGMWECHYHLCRARFPAFHHPDTIRLPLSAEQGVPGDTTAVGTVWIPTGRHTVDSISRRTTSMRVWLPVKPWMPGRFSPPLSAGVTPASFHGPLPSHTAIVVDYCIMMPGPALAQDDPGRVHEGPRIFDLFWQTRWRRRSSTFSGITTSPVIPFTAAR